MKENDRNIQPFENQLEALKMQNAFRELQAPITNEESIDLTHNDYLNLAHSEYILQKFLSEVSNLSMSASASRLLYGNHEQYSNFEDNLSKHYQKDALVYNSGFHLNIGVLPALTHKNDLILADKLVHASLIQGLQLSDAKVVRYRHLDYYQLESILVKERSNYRYVWIVTESVFSMDGDVANLKLLVELKKKHQSFLYVDEAHAVGVLGSKGLGLGEQEGLLDEIDVLVGTLGKALASVGAYAILNTTLKSILINYSKSMIYTTALPPLNVAWSNFIFNHMLELSNSRRQLKENSQYLKRQLVGRGLKVVGESHILAIVLGDNKRCLQVKEALAQEHVYVQAVRPPTVPAGTARIRISLNTGITKEQLDVLIERLSKYAL
ncbi:MAG: 8-amino-7-oxononanoate synthase [Bacteroidales bacterium]|nr:8-amino-7-oxononanoate synthase [Bacteroidales bacterium]